VGQATSCNVGRMSVRQAGAVPCRRTVDIVRCVAAPTSLTVCSSCEWLAENVFWRVA